MTNLQDKPSYLGHRQRLREKFIQGMGNGLADYELLELALFQAYPRQDVKPIAKKLMQHFGSLSAVIQASSEELKTVQGIGLASIVVIKLIHATCLRMLKQDMQQSLIFHQNTDVINYYHLKLAHVQREEFHVLFLNHKFQLLQDEALQTGTVNYINIFPRELIKRALELSASYLVFIHNHPSGDTTPSIEDRQTTEELRNILKKLGIEIIDHLIISKLGYYSFKTDQQFKHSQMEK